MKGGRRIDCKEIRLPVFIGVALCSIEFLNTVSALSLFDSENLSLLRLGDRPGNIAAKGLKVSCDLRFVSPCRIIWPGTNQHVIYPMSNVLSAKVE